MAAIVTFRNGENVRDVAQRVAIDGALRKQSIPIGTTVAAAPSVCGDP